MDDDERRQLILEHLQTLGPYTAARLNNMAASLRRQLMDRAGGAIRLSHEGALELLFAIGRLHHVREAERQARLLHRNGTGRNGTGPKR